jgi:hypothetical protein
MCLPLKVYINNKEISVFTGARIQDAVLAYSPRSHRMVAVGTLSVFDRFGNQTEPDGPLIEGQRFSLKRTKQP